jgi:hypothetical protein
MKTLSNKIKTIKRRREILKKRREIFQHLIDMNNLDENPRFSIEYLKKHILKI